MKKKIITSVLAFHMLMSSAQVSYFVDGYHGGVYGHYPISWQTQFMTDQLRENPDWCIGLEIEPETWDSVQVRTPEAYSAFRRLVLTDSHRVEFTNPTYAQPYLFNISGESIFRQFEYGMKHILRHFPTVSFTSYATEEPCFTSQLPQILRQLGFKYMVLKNPDTCWGGYAEAFGGEVVRLTGPDGTEMLTVPRYECEGLEPGSLWQTMAWNNGDGYLSACSAYGIKHPVGMCYQDAGWKGGPWLKDRKNMKYTLWTDYMENVADTVSATPWNFSQENIRPAIMWGTQVLQRLAQQVRSAENHLVQAEKIAAMEYLEHENQPDQSMLDEAWRTLMLAQHHDAWIVPYNQLNPYGTWADAVKTWTEKTNRISASFIGDMSSSSHYRIYNTTGHRRQEVVSLPDGCYVNVDVPAFGYTTISHSPHSKVEVPVKCEEDSIQIDTDQYQITFDLRHGGIISSLIDHQYNDREVAEAGFCEVRGFFQDYNKIVSISENPAQATILVDNELVKKIRVESSIAGNPCRQTYTLCKGARVIDVELEIDWQKNCNIGEKLHGTELLERKPYYDTGYMLNLCVPPHFKVEHLYKDAPFDVCESKLRDTRFNRWDSIKNNVVLSWLDVADDNHSEGLALLTDHTTSYTHSPEIPLALTLQYAGPGLWNRDYPIDGTTKIRYALIPHSGKWNESDLVANVNDWNERLLVVSSDGKGDREHSFFQCPDKNCVLSSVRVVGTEVLARLFHAGDNYQIKSVNLK